MNDINSLIIGKSYNVKLTHVNTPIDFFIQLKDNEQKTANLVNNLDNYYRNERPLPDSDINKE
mgnify:CR=1 FL=1